MIVALRAPSRRIAIAVALSMLLHGIVMWLPQVQLPRSSLAPPVPLAARLEMLPRLAPKPAPKPAAQPKRIRPSRSPAKAPANVVDGPEPPVVTAPDSVPETVAEAVSAVAVAPSAEQPSAAEETAAVKDAPPAAAVEERETTPPLPRHAQLAFSAFKGLDNFKIGEVRHQLDISGNEYNLYAVTETVGLARLFKSYRLIQVSHGTAGKHGLRPDSFEEEKNFSSSRQGLNAAFDWQSQKLHFSHGGEVALPSGAQDILSIFYQLSQLPLQREIIPVFVSNGRKLEKYEFKIGPEEEINTPMGKLRTLPLRKLHGQNEDGFEIWLGLEYRLLPVKIRSIERSGEVVGEVIITEIRMADE